MEAWAWVLIVVALLLLAAGTLRFDWLVTAFRQRFGGAPERPETPHPMRGAHVAASHTGHVAAHAPTRRKHPFHRGGKRHRTSRSELLPSFSRSRVPAAALSG